GRRGERARRRHLGARQDALRSRHRRRRFRGLRRRLAGRDPGERRGAGAVSLPVVEIEYCRQCRWLLRAAWMAQELLTTFEDELGGVTLVPGTGGVFIVRVEGATIWSRK